MSEGIIPELAMSVNYTNESADKRLQKNNFYLHHVFSLLC